MVWYRRCKTYLEPLINRSTYELSGYEIAFRPGWKLCWFVCTLPVPQRSEQVQGSGQPAAWCTDDSREDSRGRPSSGESWRPEFDPVVGTAGSIVLSGSMFVRPWRSERCFLCPFYDSCTIVFDSKPTYLYSRIASSMHPGFCKDGGKKNTLASLLYLTSSGMALAPCQCARRLCLPPKRPKPRARTEAVTIGSFQRLQLHYVGWCGT